MTMNKYCFEIYEMTERKGTLFKGYRTVVADSTETALTSAQSDLPDNCSLLQIWVPQD